MPTYDYFCDDNGRTIEVSHRMSEKLRTWGELCERAGVKPGKTAATTPVRRLVGAAAVLSGKGAAQAPPCETTGVCCGGGACGAAH